MGPGRALDRAKRAPGGRFGRRAGAAGVRGLAMLATMEDPGDGPAPPLDALTGRWQQDSLRRGARWFGIACAVLPVADLVDSHSVIDAVMAGLATASLPGVPAWVWGALLWCIAAAAGAGWLIGWLAPRPRMALFAACVGMHLAYVIAGGAGVSALVAMLCFAYSFVVLREARTTWPEGHPGARGG